MAAQGWWMFKAKWIMKGGKEALEKENNVDGGRKKISEEII